MLPLGPHAHEEFDVVEGPRTALEVSVSPAELPGVSAVHTNIPFVVQVEVSADPYDVVWAPCVEREVETDVGDEVVEALLSVERRPGEWEG